MTTILDCSSMRRYQLNGASALLRSYTGHNMTSISYAKGSTQLTLHLQSPSAAVAAQQAAEAAAAAVEADPSRWLQHKVRRSAQYQMSCG
jgi:hypothetical protein